MSRKLVLPFVATTEFARLNGHTRGAKLAKSTRAALTAHVGGKPSATQAVLIERAVQLTVRIGAMDATFAEKGQQSDHDSRCYLAWSNSLVRTLRALGMAGVAQRPANLADHLAARAAAA